jgi:Beta-galactosidase
MTQAPPICRWPKLGPLLGLLIGMVFALVAGSVARASAVFEIAAGSPPRTLESSYFGTHMHRLRIPPQARSELLPTPWPAGLLGALRLWDSGTRWADIEPAPGRFDFGQLDHYVAQAESQSATVMLVLGSTPRWASARPTEPCPYGHGCLAEPANLDHWDRYVEAVAQRYKGRIALFELWNEPYFSDFVRDRGHPGAFFSGSADTMVELARRTRAVLDRVSPQAVLLTPGFTGSTERLELFLSKGGAYYVGGVAFHYYVATDREFVELHRQVRAAMQKHGLASLPVYNTESGFEVRAAQDSGLPPLGVPQFDERGAAAQLASSLILGAFLGVQGYYQYAWDNTRMGLLGADGQTPAAGYRAYATVRRWLSGASLLGCAPMAQGALRCRFQREGRHGSILWRPTPGPLLRIAVPRAAELVAIEDAIAGPVTGALEVQAAEVGNVPRLLWTRHPWPLSTAVERGE